MIKFIVINLLFYKNIIDRLMDQNRLASLIKFSRDCELTYDTNNKTYYKNVKSD